MRLSLRKMHISFKKKTSHNTSDEDTAPGF